MSLINSKLDDFFGLSEYDWTPAAREDAPSMYLYELVNWLTTVVDSLQINDSYKDEAYRAATAYIAQSFMVRVPPLSSSSSFRTSHYRVRLRRGRDTSELPYGSEHRDDERKCDSQHPRRSRLSR
jgi:hypothetical protein